jgi:multidrug transporter EmrE-like cation transporter
VARRCYSMVAGWLALLLALEVAAEVLLQQWATLNNKLFLVAGVMAYAALALVFANAMKHATLSSFNAMWQSGNLLVVGVYGVLALGEPFGMKQKLGFASALAAILLLR